MLNSTLPCALRKAAEFGLVCYSSSCSVRESQQYCLVLFVALIFVICEKEPFGWIWGWVLWLFWVTIAVTFVSEIFSSMPPMDIYLKLNHVRSLGSLCCCLFYFSWTLHKIDYTHITHTHKERGRERERSPENHKYPNNDKILASQPIHHPSGGSYSNSYQHETWCLLYNVPLKEIVTHLTISNYPHR